MAETTAPDDMTALVSQGLGRVAGRPVEVTRLRRAGFRGSSSFATETIEAVLAGGERLDIFAKDLNPLHQLAEARRLREDGLERSRRELWMYSAVLSRLDIGTPELLGYIWDADGERYWLFLENVGPKRLSRHGDFGVWVDSARWLGAFHRATRDLSFDESAPLARFGIEQLSRAVDLLALERGNLPETSADVLDEAYRLFAWAQATVATLPVGLVHGEYFGKNVVLRSDGHPRPIAVIDWETAGIGPLYFDLSDISAGRWTREQRLEMWRAYYSELDHPELGDWPQFCVDMAHAAFARSLGWLAWWKGGDEAHVSRWLRELQATMSFLVEIQEDALA